MKRLFFAGCLLFALACSATIVHTSFMGTTSISAHGGTNNFGSSAVIPLSSSEVCGLYLSFNCSQTNSTTGWWTVDYTLNLEDNVNWSNLFVVAIPASGTGQVVFQTNISGLAGISALRLTSGGNTNISPLSDLTNLFFTGNIKRKY